MNSKRSKRARKEESFESRSEAVIFEASPITVSPLAETGGTCSLLLWTKVSNLNRSHNSFRNNRLRTCKACINIQKKKEEKKRKGRTDLVLEKEGRKRRTNRFQLLGAELLLLDLRTSPRILGRNIRQVEEKVKDQWQSG